MIFGSKVLGGCSSRLHVPPGALTVAVIVPSLIVVGSRVSEDALTKIISFAALGIYIAFQMVVMLSAAIVLGVGVVYLVLARPYRDGTAAHGDAARTRLAAESAPLEQAPGAR
jgi:hypothetical protein